MKKLFTIFFKVSLFGLFGVVAFYAYLYFIVLDNPFNNDEFDRAVWIEFDNNMDPDNPRGEMYEDLLASHLHKGMNKAEVVALLGKPDIRDDESFVSYNLGMWSGLRIDYDSLDIKFNDSGTLVDIRRVQH